MKPISCSVLFTMLVVLGAMPLAVQGEEPEVKAGKRIVVNISPFTLSERQDDLLAWVHYGSVKFGGSDPRIRIRVSKDGLAIVPSDLREQESRLQLTPQEIAQLKKVLIDDLDVQSIVAPWFNGQGNRWDGSQDCFLIRDGKQKITLTCEYGWPSSQANRDATIQRYLKLMQAYTDLIYQVRAGGNEAIAEQVPIANAALAKHFPNAKPLTIEDFAYGEHFQDGNRRLTYVRETETDGSWDKVRVEVIVPEIGKARPGDVTRNGKRIRAEK